MASTTHHFLLLQLLLLISIFNLSSSTRTLFSATQDQSMLLTYHNGQLLTGKISINLIWYGKFNPSQRAIITDLITSLSSTPDKTSTPSVSTWWTTLEKKYPSLSLTPLLGKPQVIDDKYSLGKSLTMKQIERLASRGGQSDSVNVVLTSDDVVVEGFCMSRCGTHGSATSSKGGRFAYIWVGNSVTQCPGQCAWPFHQPVYGPQGAPLVAPNNDVGMDGITVNIASLLAGTVTNPFGDGYFQGPSGAPLEAASACPGVYGTGAYPGYAGELLVDTSSGASYNAHGVNGRKYLLPALFDPSTCFCSTLV